MLHVFENTREMPSRETGEVSRYINDGHTGLPVVIDDGHEQVFSLLSGLGDPVLLPHGLDGTGWGPKGRLEH